ncbi:MAG: phosphodiester glycosidase family protein [Candidatus Sumerlaeia bacterium]|nr:phosphodiester glycosidase family protein [Candidatus Sumerlaeia bacterium]
MITEREVLESVLGEPLRRTREVEVEEEQERELAPGVLWRRCRLRFHPERSDRPERLCVNEIEADANVASLEPVFALDHTHLCDTEEIEDAYWATRWASAEFRTSGGLREPRLYVGTAPLLNAWVSEGWRVAGTLAAESGADQTLQHLHSLEERLHPLPAFVAPGHNPTGRAGIARWLPAMPPSRLALARPDVIAALPAGFFLNFPEEFEDGHSALHQPVGLLKTSEDFVMPPWVERPCFIESGRGGGRLAMVGPGAVRLEVGGFAVPLHRGSDQPDAPHGAVWLAWDAPERRPNPPHDAAALVFSGKVLVGWGAAKRGQRPPVGGALVWLTGEPARHVLAHSEEPVRRPPSHELGLDAELEAAVSAFAAGPVLVRDGRALARDEIFSRGAAGEFHPQGPPPMRFRHGAEDSPAPRAALCLREGGWRLLVVDGRRAAEHSAGLRLEGLAKLCELRGAREALNLDGGGSAVLAIEGAHPGDAITGGLARGVVSYPSDDGGRERIVPTILAVTAPHGHCPL